MGAKKRLVEFAAQDLAIRMIELSGLELKTESNSDGDIEIVFSGLRPGEKLTSTELKFFLQQLQQAQQAMDQKRARDVLEQAVSGFTPTSELCDHLYSPIYQPLSVVSPVAATALH